MRAERFRLRIVSMLDQFLDTNHPLPRRERMAAELHTTVGHLDDLLLHANSSDPRVELLARVNLNLIMCGSGPRLP
jgi:hypothetical protein